MRAEEEPEKKLEEAKEIQQCTINSNRQVGISHLWAET